MVIMSGYTYLMAVVSFCALLGSSQGIACYQCNNIETPECRKEVTLPNVEAFYKKQDCAVCKKGFVGSGTEGLIARDCADTCSEKHTKIFGVEFDEWCCTTDYCNGAQDVHLGLAALAVFMLMRLAFF